MVRLDRFPRRNNTHVNRHQAGQLVGSNGCMSSVLAGTWTEATTQLAGVGNGIGFHVVVQRSGNLLFHVCNPENLPACP